MFSWKQGWADDVLMASFVCVRRCLDLLVHLWEGSALNEHAGQREDMHTSNRSWCPALERGGSWDTPVLRAGGRLGDTSGGSGYQWEGGVSFALESESEGRIGTIVDATDESAIRGGEVDEWILYELEQCDRELESLLRRSVSPPVLPHFDKPCTRS